MEQIYHHYEKWEDWKYNFYDSLSGKEKQEAVQTVIKTFSNPDLTRELMNKVVENWTYSCEQNLSNTSMNRVAWLGQACMSIEYKIPQTITMTAWSEVPKQYRDIADSIAEDLINKWQEKYD